MSSGAAGKFQDHYILLGIETNADSDTIQAAYSRLAQKFHPSNPETGDKTKFDAVNQAYEVLADPTLRAAFDKVKGVDHEAGNPKRILPGTVRTHLLVAESSDFSQAARGLAFHIRFQAFLYGSAPHPVSL